MMRKGLIGVFDSGFGGLEIFREIVKKLPHYDYIYLGDTARTPYGSRSQAVIYQFTRQAVDFLFKKNCWLVILACNTASSEALRKIQQEYLKQLQKDSPFKDCPLKVLGVLVPAVETAVVKTKNRKIGIIGTEAAIASKAFVRELCKLDPQVKVFQKACPLLAPIVEAGEHNSDIADLAIANYLSFLKRKDIDTLILGCTHYGLLKEKIEKFMGKKVYLIVEGAATAEKLRDYLFRHPEIEEKLSKKGRVRFFTTDLSRKFKKLGSQFFGRKIRAQGIKLY